MNIPYIQVRSNLLIQYDMPERDNYLRSIQPQLTRHLMEQQTYTGILKQGAKKRLVRSVELLVMSSKKKTVTIPSTGKKLSFHLNFITLTIADNTRNITGKEGHMNLLEPFLAWIRRAKGCEMYVWKAELQGRGQLHYHITTDTYIDAIDIKNKWNELQKRNGYLDEYYSRFGHYSPNGTDVHAVKNMDDMSGYIVKEITKARQNRESIGGKVWDCSLKLKKKILYTTFMDYEYSEVLHELEKRKEVKKIVTDKCIIYKMISRPAHSVLRAHHKREYDELMNSIRFDPVHPVLKEPDPPPKMQPKAVQISMF